MTVAIQAPQPLESCDVSRHYILLTFGLVTLTLFLGLGSLWLSSLNEARRALPIREMFLSGDWLLPTLNGEIYITKPPLYYWIGTFFSHIFGSSSEGVARFPSAVAGFLTASLCYLAVKRHSSPWAAVFALQILVANSGFSVHSRRAELEVLQALFCFGALYCAREYLSQSKTSLIYGSYVLLGLAVMTKGPVALVFVTLPLLVYTLLSKDGRARTLLMNTTGWALCLLVSLPWFLLVTQEIGLEGWQPILQRDIAEKITGRVETDPIYSYLLWITLAFSPAVLILFCKPREAWHDFRGDSEQKLWLLAFLLPLLIFTLFLEKHAKYMLPAYPALAILLGTRIAKLREQSSQRGKAILSWIGPVLLLSYIAYFNFGEAHYFAQRYKGVSELRNFMATQQGSPPLYSHENFDVRAIYYVGSTVRELPEKDLLWRYRDTPPALFFFDTRPKTWQPGENCLLKQINQFMKKDRQILIYRNGPDCTVIDGTSTTSSSPTLTSGTSR